jgi:uncharacterized protein
MGERLMAAQCSEHSMKIDAFELARNAERIAGEIALADMPRLSASLLETRGSLRYMVQGRVDADGPGADLALGATLRLSCQRCNAPLDYTLDRTTRFRFVRSETELEAQPLDDDEADPIIASKAMDLRDWIEDEAILSLPLVPRHERCETGGMSEADDGGRQRPFAVLAALKRGGEGKV